MGKSRKYINKSKVNKGLTTKNKRRAAKEKEATVNKKALFNRYKNKQKIAEELCKKKNIERELYLHNENYTENEEEEDPYDQLVSCFSDKSRNQVNTIDSDDDSKASEGSNAEDFNFDYPRDTSIHESDLHDATDTSNSEIMLFDENADAVQEDMSNDPFTTHLEFELEDELVVSLTSSLPNVEKIMKSWSTLGKLFITIPKPIEISKKINPKFCILEEKTFASTGVVPQVISKVDFNQLHIKSQVCGNVVLANKTNLIKRDLDLTDVFTNLQKELFSIINNYQDLYYPQRTFNNSNEIRYIYCLHAINHMLKTRTKIIHHNAKLSKKSDVCDEYRDQGLVRPKVLILVPFKDAAYRVVKTLIEILVPKESGQVVNKKRFEEDFTGGELLMPRKNPKPEDYELMFSGNTDDTFKLGMSVTKKTLKLYTDFYSSDILVASPLGLRMIIGAEGEEDRDYDFLASIELLILDQADVFLMQNWDHVLHVIDHLHLQPKKTHGTDFSRVRSWAVNGWSKYYRQTLIFSSVALPQIKAVVNKKCQNYAGKVEVSNPVQVGSIQQVIIQMPQVFHRFTATSPLQSVDARFEYFVKEILPKQRDALMSHTLIYVPSYFDYVRLRNYFKKEDISFVQICEYSKDGKIARARDMFFHTEAHFLLYSERVHFFRRLRLKGIRHVVFYQPPTYQHFYSEICNLMQESNQNKYGGSEFNMSVSVLYCKYDMHQVSGVLGGARADSILNSEKCHHVFITGDS